MTSPAVTSNTLTIGPDSEIEYLRLPSRSYTALCRDGIERIRDITRHTPASLRKISGLGEVSAQVIELKLQQLGLSLRSE